MAKGKARADELLVRAGLADSIATARALVMAGRALARVEGRERRIEKAGELLPEGAELRAKGKVRPFASRAGEKLDAALSSFGVAVAGRVCADFGIGTGGFTDCLLGRGAVRVHGVDVGYGDVAWSIRGDPRVRLYERTNVRTLAPLHFGERVALATVDLSFISLSLVLGPILLQLDSDGEIVALVKPQFEAERSEIGEGGVIHDDGVRGAILARVRAAFDAHRLAVVAELESPLRGADGNIEVLVHARRVA
jgi:23S rRNA (cytidine1920-2'-O)/16S rRNA (cytidine1409-2'-O)-methyltransferase